MDIKVTEGRILDAVHKSLQWQDGEIAGIDMLQLEQRVNGILKNFAHEPTKEPHTEALNKHNVGGRSEQFTCHSCKTVHSGKNDDQLYEVCSSCFHGR